MFAGIKYWLAYKYADHQKLKKRLNTIKYGNCEKPKMALSKKLTIYILTNFTIIEIYCLIIMAITKDLSSLPTLITVSIGEVVSLISYLIKSAMENISDKGFVYEARMKDMNSDCVG